MNPSICLLEVGGNNYSMTRSGNVCSINRTSQSDALYTYKVYVNDGHEELIRGASANSIPVRSLRQIEAVGNDLFVANRLSGGDLPTPTSVVAPSVLLEEVDLKRPAGTQQKPSLLTHPYFN